ncbi:hypothetical protein C8J56DRAFT_830557 [Mycena floridula]|nr:hypothetical protein C8J56DRAFT_830557 [Mycena floridula]
MTSSATTANGIPPAWRQFSFFDVVPVKDVHDLGSTPDIFKATSEISTIALSSVGLVVADIHGSLHLLNKDFESIQSWIGHVGGRVTHIVEHQGILVTLGEEDAVRAPLIKIWDLKVKDKKTGGPHLLRSSKISVANRPHPVSTLALSATLSHLAIGFTDGSVILYRHLDQSLASSGSLSTIPKPRTIHENPTEPITGLGFKEATEEHPNLVLFIATTNRVLLYQVTGKGSGGVPSVLDDIGSALRCATMDSNSDMILARDEAIYVFGVEGRGTCYAYEGSKLSIHTHKSYLVFVSPPVVPTAASISATIRHAFARTPTAAEVTKVTVFDPENKFVAYNGTFPEGVREIISAWGNVYVLSNNGELKYLQEKPTSTKLEMLYSKSQYVLALNLAKTQGLDESSVADIHRQFGDSQYSKGDYDGAMHQFVQTIGFVQPSYVIRKFLDAQRIHSLVTYLQELHALGLANADHTTLLLNMYTKLKDVSRLDSFIRTESRRGDDSGELPFDLETAIRVCRQAGYFEHAAYLARKYERHEEYLRIQIEDAGNYADALVYLRKLGPEVAESNLARYGRAMLVNLPEETTQLLIDLCTTAGALSFDVEETPIPPTPQTARNGTGPSYLAYLALNRHSVVGQTDSVATPSIRTARPGDLASERNSVHEDSGSPSPPLTATVTNLAPIPPVKPLSPRLYFAHFVDHMQHFVVFLETVASRRWGQGVDFDNVPPRVNGAEDERDQIAVWNTLLELYLTLESRDKALRLLQSPHLPYDPTHALILCSSFEYTPGLVLLWEKMGMYEDVLRFWMDKDKEGNTPNASGEVVKHLKIYGAQHPALYILVLRFLTSTPELLTKHRNDVVQVLDHVEKEGIISPLEVIQVLSRNGVASVGLVKAWLMARIKDARTEIQTDQEWISSYRMETEAKLKLVDELSDPDHPRVFHVTRCSTCKAQLDLPSVHFMCNHSYHQRCLPDQDTECPNCAREYSVIREIRRNNQRLADQHDVFLAEVQESGFKGVAEAFGRGFLNFSRLDDVAV